MSTFRSRRREKRATRHQESLKDKYIVVDERLLLSRLSPLEGGNFPFFVFYFFFLNNISYYSPPLDLIPADTTPIKCLGFSYGRRDLFSGV